jgi:hypothetical protein
MGAQAPIFLCALAPANTVRYTSLHMSEDYQDGSSTSPFIATI